MTKTVVADIAESILKFESANSDRFVFSNYFIPRLLTFADGHTPIMPFYAKEKLLQLRERYGDSVVGILNQLGFKALWEKNAMEAARAALGDFDGTMMLAPPPSHRPSVLGEQRTELVAALLSSDIGYAFLDRTRIRPAGFALGEHVYALGLAPGEEVILEQKAFSKRQVTFEEQDEREKQFDTELTSTLSTEIEEGFERQRTLTDTWGLTASHTGNYSSPPFFWGQFNASHTIGFSKNVTEAHQETGRRSVKDSETASSKLSAKYRALHKTTFKVTEEQGLETSSKRTVRNPNRTTPITLHYFKVLQRLRLQQERYGARVCWAPSIEDPGRTFLEKIQRGRKRLLDEANQRLPPPPTEPKPAPQNAPGTTTSETKWFYSAVKAADHWTTGGGMNWEYDVDVPHDEGFVWDEQINTVKSAVKIFSKRELVNSWVVGRPYAIQDEGGQKLRVRIHIDTGDWWFGGPGIDYQVGAQFRKTVTVVQQNNASDTYKDDLTVYRTALKEWNDRKDAATSAAQEAGDALERQFLAGLSPINEMMSQVIEQRFANSYRDEYWEIEYWQRIFDWERASFVAYPSWWSSAENRCPQLDPADFLNASWARLYLPVRAGMERLALRWLLGKSVAEPLSAEIEACIDAVVDDLRKFRETALGEQDELPDLKGESQKVVEKVHSLGSWDVLMPTDGTHLETIQGITSAADSVTALELTDAANLRAALIENEKITVKLKDVAKDRMTAPAAIQVQLGDGSTGEK